MKPETRIFQNVGAFPRLPSVGMAAAVLGRILGRADVLPV